jgi:hypothetical protein
MSQASGDAGTGEGGHGAGTPPGGDTTFQWEDIVKDLADGGRRAIERASERARHNIGLVRNRKYGYDAWLDDVKWFWQGVAEASEHVVDGIRKHPRPS